MRSKWRKAERLAGGVVPLWPEDNVICNAPALTSEHLAASGRVIHGHWRELILGL